MFQKQTLFVLEIIQQKSTLGKDLYYFSANQDDYNNIANFINGDSNFLQINTMTTIYSTDKSNTFRKRG